MKCNNPSSIVCLGQATKEAEYRERVADLKSRIDSCTQSVAAEEAQVATAKARRCLPLSSSSMCPTACCACCAQGGASRNLPAKLGFGASVLLGVC